ncbi:hypothetical protein GCM10007876_27540 [Litoribrevibacter albus]|uniref:Haem-binding uptake Tiki superfamily ChaN domain-containing protein n=2 Tax=Litoribrevibacter albus TaxID=1473156 RepID=A0AA37W794_9GAMM|nr:hypothetical protein GCM10007876_27540 [Litoribrevibacter albus]
MIVGCSPYIRTQILWESTLSTDHSLVGDIVRISDLRRVQPEQLIKELSSADYVLIGEKHDNPDHHNVQNWLLTELLPETKYNLVFEMLNYNQQDAISALSSSSLPTDISDAANFDQSGWPSKYYTPLIQTGLSRGAQIIAGNLPKDDLMTIYQEGFSALEPTRFTTSDALNQEQLSELEDRIFQDHCGILPASQTAPMAKIQIAKDASMAYSMSKSDKAVLIAGNYHVNKTIGVPRHLTMLAPKKKTVVVQIVEVDDNYETVQMLNSDKLAQADYLWFTPRWTDKDYCDDMKQHTSKK